MRIYDVIAKKRDGHELTREEMEFLINGFLNGVVKDYQMSAFLMAVFINGMSDSECETFTGCMIDSGNVMDLSAIDGIKVDKHSTGGVGDKTTLIVTPIVAACGVKVAKMSGRGLGHTGGTVDKLESIPGFNICLSQEKFFDIVNGVGCSVISQTANLAPADKKIYALRDVTATVESMPLIASSIMSKKIASGANCIVLDVKVGNGAFMKTLDDAVKLSEIMVNIGEKFGRKVAAVITDMNSPLGFAIGNSLEVWESCQTLLGNGPKDLYDVSICLASYMLMLAGKGSLEECTKMANEAVSSGKAYAKFKSMVEAQGGSLEGFENDTFMPETILKHDIVSPCDGYITSMQAEKLGKASMILGAGRQTKEDEIDYSAGIILSKKIGDKVAKGEVLATLYSSDASKFSDSEKMFTSGIEFSSAPQSAGSLIKKIITA